MMHTKILGIGAAVLLLLTGTSTAWADEPELQTLESVEQLQDVFNKDAGSPRVVLLLSPT